MGQTLTEKILDDHLVEGTLEPGEEIGIEIDQVLTQDTTGTMVWLQFEALELDEVQTELAAQYCDHQTYQFDFKNTDDHRFLRSAAGTYGAYFSRPGNGICHNVHKENFAAPGKTMLGSDSHTPTPGGLGELAIGAGGLDVAVAMGGGPYFVEMPEVVNVRLEGELPDWASAKDLILEMLRRLSVKGGVGKVFEYTGPGVESLSVPERTTVTNMGTELGATTSIFPTDDRTKEYLERQGRGDEYVELAADADAEYADEIVVDLSDLEPLISCPSMPDNVVPVREVAGTDVEQVIVGSCTNGGYEDILPAAKMLEGREIKKDLEMIVAPGSKQAGELLAREGWTAEMMAAGVNVSEATCGPCIGIGVWCLYRHRPRPRLRLRLPPDLQPELRGSLGHRERLGVPLLAAGGRRGGDQRRNRRPAGSGRGTRRPRVAGRRTPRPVRRLEGRHHHARRGRRRRPHQGPEHRRRAAEGPARERSRR